MNRKLGQNFTNHYVVLNAISPVAEVSSILVCEILSNTFSG